MTTNEGEISEEHFLIDNSGKDLITSLSSNQNGIECDGCH